MRGNIKRVLGGLNWTADFQDGVRADFCSTKRQHARLFFCRKRNNTHYIANLSALIMFLFEARALYCALLASTAPTAVAKAVNT